MAKYTPLNLSFLANQYSPQRDSIANTAAMIVANAGWQPSTIKLKEIKEAQDKAKKDAQSLHKQSFLSTVIDTLSTPMYGLANALDEALAGHQSDSNDSVVEDIAKTTGGVFTGAARGVGAGLRGASGLLDVLPGVDINDEWQSDPTDKTHFSDVAIRQQVGMASGDAMKPENWEKIRPKLEAIQKKSLWNKTAFELAIPDDLSPDNLDAQEDYLRRQMLTGIPVDIGADPLNAVFLGGGSAARLAKGTKAATEGLQEARANKAIVDSIDLGMATRASRGSVPFKNSFDAPAPIQALADVPNGVRIPIANVSPETSKVFKTLENVGRRSSGPKQGLAISERDQHGIASQIVKWAVMGDAGWRYRAANYLGKIHPGLNWDRTFEFLEQADRAVKAAGGRHNPEKMAPVLRQRMMEDVLSFRKADEVADVARFTGNVGDNIAEVGVKNGKIKKGAKSGLRMKAADAKLANQVVRRFESEILGRKGAPGTGPLLAQAIARGDNVRYSGPQQARMWNQINVMLNKIPPAYRYKKATSILKMVEDYFISKGMIPHSAAKTAESVPLRLSQLAEAIGPSILGKSHAFVTGILRGDPKALAQLTDAEVQAIDALKASEAIASAPAVQKGITAGREIAAELARAPMSVGRKTAEINKAIRDIKTFTAASGGGDVGAKIAGEHLASLVGKGDPINKVLSGNKWKTEAWLSKVGRPGARHFLANDPKFVRSVTAAIGRAANLPDPATLGRLSGPAARVTDWLGARFNAAYGVQDMRPIFLKQQASAMSTTGRRAKLLNALGRTYSPNDADLWHEAFRAAQTNGVSSGRVAELQAEISKVMENLFGGTGLRNGAIADSTVIGRNRLFMDELNANLKRFGLSQHQFINKKVKDATGATRDFSKGTEWLKSWEIWEVSKPYEFLHKVQSAVEFTVREKAMFDEVITRFASPAKKGSVKYGVDHPRLRGFYFTAEGARQAKVFVRMLDEVATPSSKTLQHFDHVLSKLKASLTIYIPGHHWTNLIGDVYYNWIAGVNKPIRYDQAIKVMLAQKGRYGDFASFDKLTGPKALEQAMARSLVDDSAGLVLPAAGNKAIVTMQNGTKVTADMIYTAAFREGILPSARILEDVTTDVSSVLDKIKPFGGNVQRGVHQVSEVRDHIPRLAQFIDGIAKSKGSFVDAVQVSARGVRKWHPDGLDLTKFERTAMKRVFPFYSWTRKAIPLAIESAVFAGPKVMAYPRLMEAIALMNGVTPEQGTRDPFPDDQLFPDWLRERGIGPIMGGPGNYTTVNPSTPVLDTFALMGKPGQGSLDMLNPMIKVPIEVGQGQTVGRNIPIGTSNADWMNYAAKQIPVVSQAGRASGQFGVSESTQAEGFPNWMNIVNMLTGAKAVNTGKYIKSGQFDLKEYLKERQQG